MFHYMGWFQNAQKLHQACLVTRNEPISEWKQWLDFVRLQFPDIEIRRIKDFDPLTTDCFHFPIIASLKDTDNMATDWFGFCHSYLFDSRFERDMVRSKDAVDWCIATSGLSKLPVTLPILPLQEATWPYTGDILP